MTPSPVHGGSTAKRGWGEHQETYGQLFAAPPSAFGTSPVNGGGSNVNLARQQSLAQDR